MSAVPNFDVSNLVGLSFDPLREVIEFLLGQLREQSNTLQELQAKIDAAP